MIDKNNKKEVMKEVKKICDSYANNKRNSQSAVNEIERLKRLKKDCTDKGYLELIDESIKVQQDMLFHCFKETAFFETAISRLEDRTAFIMKQLYDEEISWDFIKDRRGKILSRDTIARERRKAFKLMVEMYPTSPYINYDENRTRGEKQPHQCN